MAAPVPALDPNGANGFSAPPPLTPCELSAYLAHLCLPASTASRKPSHELLRDLQVAHVTHVPFETTPLHLPEAWGSPALPADAPLRFGEPTAEKMPFKPADCLQRVLARRRGGFCFLLNTIYARLLAALGFSVSHLLARVYRFRHQDPATAGYDWTPKSHLVLRVTWPGDASRAGWLSDVGFGSGTTPWPIAFEPDREAPSPTEGEKFRLKREPLPGFFDPGPVGAGPAGWTLERWTAEHWTPCYHIEEGRTTAGDITSLSWYITSSPTSQFAGLFTVTKLLPNAARRTLLYVPGMLKAKVYTRQGVLGESTDVYEVEPTYGALWDVCRKEFAFGP